jgi:dihydroorotate dehydrogenase electron transfer subunit
MRQFILSVAEVAVLPGLVRVRCEGSAPIFAPGQAGLAFTHLSAQPFLRVPLYPFHSETQGFEFCLETAHPFAALAPGDELDVVGPCGRGFDLPPRLARLLLVGVSPARLFSLMHLAIERRLAVTMLIPPDAPRPSLPEQVELQRGALTAELADWADLIALDVPEPEALARRILELRPGRSIGSIQALTDVPMPCGTGACQACWVETRRGRKLACVDGPVIQW